VDTRLDELPLADDTYVLVDGRAWLVVNGFSVRIWQTDSGIAVDIFDRGNEMGSPVAVTYAYAPPVSADTR
jgi:hypothetical protein